MEGVTEDNQTKLESCGRQRNTLTPSNANSIMPTQPSISKLTEEEYKQAILLTNKADRHQQIEIILSIKKRLVKQK